MTSLPNRYALLTTLETELAAAHASRRQLALIFFDVDHFKSINDSYCHLAGDVVLQQVGARVRQLCHPSVSLGRYGGEEFNEVAPGDGVALAERLCSGIAQTPIPISGSAVSLTVTISVGVASYPHDGATSAALIDKADQAMYQAKQSGRNRVCLTDTLRAVMTAQARFSTCPDDEMPLAS